MRYVDLTQPLRDGDCGYPGDPAVGVSPQATHQSDGYRVTRFVLGSHSGTHVDAPSHFVPSGSDVDDYPIETFAFDAAVVDVTDSAPREVIEDVELPDDPTVDLVAFHTGWAERFESPAYFDHPAIDPTLASRLADEGYHVGIDAPSVDPSPSATVESDSNPGATYPAHDALLGAGRLIVENLTGLDRVPRRFTLLAFPMAIADVEAAPVRAVGMMPD